jgi:hypothetical protein
MKDLSQEQKLQKIIEKAKKNGWDKEKILFNEELMFMTPAIAEMSMKLAGQINLPSLIFRHDFAKAFWGEEYVCSDCGNRLSQPHMSNNPHINPDELPHSFVTDSWQYHLQQLALTPDNERIDYLFKFI